MNIPVTKSTKGNNIKPVYGFIPKIVMIMVGFFPTHMTFQGFRANKSSIFNRSINNILRLYLFLAPHSVVSVVFFALFCFGISCCCQFFFTTKPILFNCIFAFLAGLVFLRNFYTIRFTFISMAIYPSLTFVKIKKWFDLPTMRTFFSNIFINHAVYYSICCNPCQVKDKQNDK